MDNSSDQKRRQTEGARQRRQEIATESDNLILGFIRENPSITSAQLQEFLSNYKGEKHSRFSKSYLINALKRLEEKDLVTWKVVQKDKKFVKLYYFNFEDDAKAGKRANSIEIFKKELNNSEAWKNISPFVYAINSSELLVTPGKDQILAETSLVEEEATLKVVNNEVLSIILPEHIMRFYGLNDRHRYQVEITDKNKISIKITPEVKKQQDMCGPSKTILIMEDDEYWRDNIAEKFVERGHKVLRAANEDEAISQFRQNHVDYVILDWDIGGRRVAQEVFLEMRWKDKNIPVSLITAHPVKETLAEFTKLGFINIIKKQRKSEEEIDEIVSKELARMGTVSAN